MSASREKQIRQEQASSGWVDPKVVREQEQRKKEKRINILYGTIAALFLIAVIAAGIWRSNVIPKNATAVTIDGEKYTAAEVGFYYQNVYQNFVSNYSYLLSYMGLNTNASLDSQTITETAASWIGAEVGQTWKDYFLGQALDQMATVQSVLNTAKAEGYTYSAGVQAQYEDSMVALKESAEANSVSVSQLLKNKMGAQMTEKVYAAQLMRMLQYDDYASTYYESLTYDDSKINDAYKADTNKYDLVSYELVAIPGTAASTTDAQGNAVESTEEESAAALEKAEKAADQMLADYRAGQNLETLSKTDESYVYTKKDSGTYSGDVVTEWLFDGARKAGDSTVLDYNSTYYVAVFLDRFRNETPEIDVRHILIQPAASTLSEGDEGYEAEQAQLKADAKAKAEDILAQWQAGEATEASFSALAMQESADGSKYTGGLIDGITPDSSLVESFKNWCLDASRKPGDTGVVESDYGAHVMYFVGEQLPVWKANVVSDLRDAEYSEWLEGISADSTIERHGFGMKFVG